jgi:hypothetical protein
MGSDLIDALALREGRKHEVVASCRAASVAVLAAKQRSR